MTDLHTHILPGMDDGARSAEESIALLRAQRSQGVRRVALTPHFYPRREGVEDFLCRREKAWSRLQRALDSLGEERGTLPELTLGAEVAWQPGSGRWEDLEKLRIGESGPVLMELPFQPWSGGLLRELYDLICRSEAPVALAHLDRYLGEQKKSAIQEIYAMGVPIQLGADRLLRFWGRREILKLLEQEFPFFLASDCHRTDTRPPCLAQGVQAVAKALGQDAANTLLARSDALFSPVNVKGEQYASK